MTRHSISNVFPSMTAFSLRRCLSVCALLVLPWVARAADPAILTKAREFVGSETALTGLKSIHYTGTLVTSDPTDATKQTRATLEIIFQKPQQQRITATSDTTIETTALDGYDGWQEVRDAKDTTRGRLTLLNADQIKRLRANTWENLAFFRGIERAGGRTEDQGTQTIDGKTCQKIAFIHGPNIMFIRYFDTATGRLMLTETEAGGTIREQGEMIVVGIRFPRSIITTTKNAKGESQTVTINFDKIVTNETFPTTLFAVPFPR
jgi:outer membrane lipoprotein-sorting protein